MYWLHSAGSDHIHHDVADTPHQHARKTPTKPLHEKTRTHTRRKTQNSLIHCHVEGSTDQLQSVRHNQTMNKINECQTTQNRLSSKRKKERQTDRQIDNKGSKQDGMSQTLATHSVFHHQQHSNQRQSTATAINTTQKKEQLQQSFGPAARGCCS